MLFGFDKTGDLWRCYAAHKFDIACCDATLKEFTVFVKVWRLECSKDGKWAVVFVYNARCETGRQLGLCHEVFVQEQCALAARVLLRVEGGDKCAVKDSVVASALRYPRRGPPWLPRELAVDGCSL